MTLAHVSPGLMLVLHHHHDDMATMLAALQRLSSPPAQTLRTLQPTQATVSYTVTTRPAATTVPARLSFCTGIALRILVGTAVALLAWTKWCASRDVPAVALSWTLGNARAEELLLLVSRLPWRYLVPASVCTVYLALRRGYTGTLRRPPSRGNPLTP
jgi:phosphatidylinositol glycan class H protein